MSTPIEALRAFLKYVADRAGQSATGCDPITLSDTATITGKYRALRFNVAGDVKLTVIGSDGKTESDVTRTVFGGERWDAAFVVKVWSTGTTSGMTVDGWS